MLFIGVSCYAPHYSVCVWDQKSLVPVQAARHRCSRRCGAQSYLKWHLAQSQPGMRLRNAAS